MAQYVSQLIARVAVEGAALAKSELEGVGVQTEKTKGILSGAFSMAAGQAIFAGLGFLKNEIDDTISSAINQQAIMAQTRQAIKSTGDASGLSASQIGDMADRLTKLTTFSDDTIQSGENLLLTFTNIGKDTFPQATKAMLDMSQAMGQDTKESAIQLGKALNDPAQGMSALQRIGVTFSSTQKDLIKTYMAHGEIAKAQGVILKELSKEFGGSAEAAGKTFGGQLQIAQNKLGLFKEEIGTALLPKLADLAGFVTGTIIPGFENMVKGVGNVIQWFGKHEEAATALKVGLVVMGGAIVGVAVPAFIAWAGAAGAAAVATIAATWPALAIGAAVGLGVAGIVLAVKHWGDITKWISGVWTESINWIGGVFSGFGTKVHDIVGAIGNAFSGLGTFVHGVWDGIVGGIKDAINWIIGAIDTFIGALDSIKINLGPIHVGLNIPQIPKLDTGGFIESTGLAVVHKGETVVPPGTSIMPSSITNATSQNSRPIVINLHMNGRQTATALIPDLVELIRNGTGTYGL